MNQMKILIVEDDFLIAEHLKDILKKEQGDEVLMALSAMEAKQLIDKNKSIDLVLLDINMETPEAGINLAYELSSNYGIPFIYISAQSDTTIIRKAASTFPLSYIVKPFVAVSVQAAVQMARQKIANSTLCIRDGYKDVIIPFDAIYYGKSNNNYIEIYGHNKKWVARVTMRDLLNDLPKDRFVQVHRSFFINKFHLESLKSDKVVVKGECIPVSKSFETSIKGLF
jgi:two-component system, LytTR family, response regulator LytT